MIVKEEIIPLEAKDAVAFLQRRVSEDLKIRTTTRVYMNLIELMVACKEKRTETERHLFEYCDQILNELDNG